VTPNRRFLYEVIGKGVELGCITPEDVIQHITPEVLAHHLPVALKARLLQVSLAAERMSPALIVEAVGVDALVEHAPMTILWACVRSAAERQLGAPLDRPLGAGAGMSAGNGASLPARPAHGDELALKPPKSARPTTARSPSRVSALSPRSRALGRSGELAGSGAEGAGNGHDEFEVVEETDIRRGSERGSAFVPGDEDTRPGSKN
jgi:hypothetical protein